MANGEKGKGRSQNQRLKLFYLLDYLLENTDETHAVKVQQTIDRFDNYYKIPVEQKPSVPIFTVWTNTAMKPNMTGAPRRRERQNRKS